jgi:hypothetical protein
MGRVAWVSVALPGMVSWHAGIITLGAVIATGILRLLAEWQRRATGHPGPHYTSLKAELGTIATSLARTIDNRC